MVKIDTVYSDGIAARRISSLCALCVASVEKRGCRKRDRTRSQSNLSFGKSRFGGCGFRTTCGPSGCPIACRCHVSFLTCCVANEAAERSFLLAAQAYD
jgi:hypothetical protein